VNTVAAEPDEPSSHISMPINADGDGPEMDESKVADTICWTCLESWPCGTMRKSHRLNEGTTDV
jgi:hypothetical protein